jgi:hypothetical protein
MSFGYATREFEVTADRLGVYRPEEHIGKFKLSPKHRVTFQSPRTAALDCVLHTMQPLEEGRVDC